MPYRTLLESDGRTYTAVDVDASLPIIHAGAERLPFPDSSFDVVVCFQVLEHLPSPKNAVLEFHRVLKPAGRVLASTHGVFPYHPHPTDFWRWTAEGLDALFGSAGFKVEITGLTGTMTTLATLAGYYINLGMKRYVRLAALRAVIPGLLRLGQTLDKRFPELSDPWRDGTLISVYFVDGVKETSSVVGRESRRGS
jgi:SAM-dependent methyltransferase